MSSRLRDLRAFAASGTTGFRSDVAFLLGLIDKRDAEIAALRKVRQFPKRGRIPAFDPGVDRIVRVVAVHFGVDGSDIYGKEHWKRFAWARHAVALIARDTMALSFPALGAAMNGRDHTTILASYRRGLKLRETDGRFRSAVEACERALAPVKAEGEAA